MFIEIKTQEEAGEEVPRGGWCHRAWTRTAALGARAPDRTGIGRPASFPALQLIAREVFGGGGKKIFLIKKKKKRKEIKTHTWNIYSSTLLSSQPYYKRYGL